MTDEELIAAAIRAACPDPDVDCLDDQATCFEHHPIHEVGRVRGVIETVEADVEPLATLVVAALAAAGRLGPGSTSPIESGGVE